MFLKRALYFGFKPIVIYTGLGAMASSLIDEHKYVTAAMYAGIALVAGLLVGITEIKMAKKYIRYSTKKRQDAEGVLKVMAPYLQDDFNSMKVYMKSMRGKYCRRGFEQDLHIKIDGNDILVCLSGNFPFPASLINWSVNHLAIARELNTHAYYQA